VRRETRPKNMPTANAYKGYSQGKPVGDEAAARHCLLAHRDGYEAAAAGREHPRDDRPSDEERSVESGLDDVVESARRDLPERPGIGEEPRVDRSHADSGVVDEQVQATKALEGLRDRRLDRRSSSSSARTIG
jgi:hypothetical protein